MRVHEVCAYVPHISASRYVHEVRVSYSFASRKQSLPVALEAEALYLHIKGWRCPVSAMSTSRSRHICSGLSSESQR